MNEPATTCPIEGCARAKKHEHLFCLHHWKMVPRDVQHRVWDTWRALQRRRGTVHDYREAVEEATSHVTAGRSEQRSLF